PLPLLRHDRPRRQGCRRALQGRHRARRQAQDPEGDRNRAEGDSGRQPFLRRQGRRADAVGRRLPRQAAQDRAQAERGLIALPERPRRIATLRRGWGMARRMSVLTVLILLLVLLAAGYGALHYMTAVPGAPYRGAPPPLTEEEAALAALL